MVFEQFNGEYLEALWANHSCKNYGINETPINFSIMVIIDW